MSWNQKPAVVGIGRTKATSKRPEVSTSEMINEAVRQALDDAGLGPKDIDITFIGDMELFQGDLASDMWQADYFGAGTAPEMRMTCGGTLGAALVCSGAYAVASEAYDVALVIGWQKHDEGNATTGLVSIEDATWYGWVSSGVGGGKSLDFIRVHGEKIEKTAAIFRAQASEAAARNPYAHLRQKLTVEDVMNSPYISYPQRVLHLCPQSNGACAMVIASEKVAEKISKKPVWIQDFVTVHHEQAYPENKFGGEGANTGFNSTYHACSERLYERTGIVSPVEEIDIYEIYNPSVWFTFDLMESTLRLPSGGFIDLIESGATALDGSFPVCPSGGVVATNPIGATAMLRIAEAALQIRGDCEAYQVKKDVNTALASGFGGSGWYVLHLLTKEKDWKSVAHKAAEKKGSK